MMQSSLKTRSKAFENFSIKKHFIYFYFSTVVRQIAMPTECTANPLQRDLADSIVMMLPLDEIRLLLAGGAKVSHQYFRLDKKIKILC